MKLSTFRVLPYLAVLLLSLAACNNTDKTEDATTADTTTAETNTPTPAPVNTIITTPQSMVFVRHKIKNFSTWITNFEGHDSARQANGLRPYVVSRGLNDSNMVMVTLRADDMEKAKVFVNDPSLAKVMQKGGVIGKPSIMFVTLNFHDTAAVNTELRSHTVFKVKDYAAWEKAFKEGEQERLDNGFSVSAYGQDVNDSNKVRLITALIDTAKARAYWSSDMLKKRRAASGAIGEPERFVYKVVKRY